MNRITFPLEPQGAAVVDLQEALQLLLDRGVLFANNEATRRRMSTLLQRELALQSYGRTTGRLVTEFQQARLLETTGEVDKPTADLLNAQLKAWGLLDDSNGEQIWVVRGRIISHELRGLTGWRVVAMDKNVGQDVRLGEATSGKRGTYEIRYAVSGLQKQKPDVQVQVIDQNGERVAVSAVRYNAERNESGLDVMIPADKLPRPAEYRRLIGELGTHLGNPDEPRLKRRLAALKEDEQQQDITYLANKSGWDARMVAMTSLASQFAQRSGIEPEFYYALFRAGVPANETVLSQMAPQTVQQTWERAVALEILPAELEDQIPDALQQFKAHSATRLLQEEAQIGRSSFKELIEGTLDEPAQQRFAQLYYDQKDDLETFWQSVRTAFPNQADRLQLDSQLAFLTTNNAPIIQRLHEQNGNLQAPLDLVRQGLYQSEAWESVLGDDLSDLSIPDEIPGESPEEKKSNYAAVMASQLRLSYPTAVVAEMVRADAIPLRAEEPVKERLTQFLDAQQGNFELGIHPVEQYLRQNDIALEAPALAELKTLQRVYQISPSDEAMGKLLEHGLDSAVAVTRYDEQTFVRSFKNELGGEALARLTYAKAHQVHHTVLNIATSYLLEKSAFPLYAFDTLAAFKNAEESGVLAYPTLEGIFGEMDYCACKHCQSWLSPAAYLVDLLQFLDPPTHEKGNPLDVLLGRRPDIQHLQLTCENTNTVLPYIDLVNEVLEHYVVNGSLNSFTGHNIEQGTSTEELLASAQFVNDAAYTQLRNQLFPLPLPFHQPLLALRRYVDHFDVPLHEAMERLRAHDHLERANDVTESAYGWQDILMERLQLSRPEYAILTDSSTPLQRLYGESPSLNIEAFIDRISNAKTFARLLNLSYEALIEIIRTQFINSGSDTPLTPHHSFVKPSSHLIPKLERLIARDPIQPSNKKQLTLKSIRQFVLGETSETDFAPLLLPLRLNKASYGGHITKWLKDNKTQLESLIMLLDPTDSEDICSFDTVELRYALPDFEQNKLRKIEFLKLLRFIRLWRKLGWSIEQTDKAIIALYPTKQYPTSTNNYQDNAARLDQGFESLLVRLAHLQIVMEQLGLKPKRDLIALLACWSPIDTHGERSLYRQMFLNPTILDIDDLFQEDGYGNYLAEKKEYQTPRAELPTISGHTDALRAAFNLTEKEFTLILSELNFDGDTVLNLTNVSAIFRHGYLARNLRLSVSEFLALKAMSGLNPFLPLDLVPATNPAQPFGAVRPPAIRFIELTQAIKESPLEITQLLYFLQHVDLSGNASPSNQEIMAFAQSIRHDLLRIDSEHLVQDDPSGEIAKSKMVLVYGNEATDIFFGLLNNTSLFTVDYHHGQPALENNILALTNRITYDDFQKKLSFQGVMTGAEKSALDGATSATDPFRTAVQALFDDGQNAFAAFFNRYPDLEALYQNFADSNAPLEDKMSALLADFLPDLKHQLKRQEVRQTVSTQVDAELALVTPLLENPSLLHAVGVPAESAIIDFLALESQGVSADIFFADDVIGAADQSDLLVHTIDYREGGATLPSHPAGDNISGVWRGALEVPDNGFYNFYIQADANAEISLELDGKAITLVLNNGVWQNQEAIDLQAGRLYDLTFTAERVKDLLVLKWERKGLGRAPIPAAQLYPAAPLARFRSSYLRLLKALAIADTLELSATELEHFAVHDDYSINNAEGWLNALPVAPSPAGATTHALLRNISGLLQYRALKDALKIRDESLLQLLQEPSAVGKDGVLLLNRVTGWQEADLATLLDHFGLATGELTHLEHFSRLHEAFVVLKKLGIGAATLINNTTNEPTADMQRELQAALRARYDQSAWLQVIQPINDNLRTLQRDALVAYVLHQLTQNPATEHIDTPNKLFEYFLIDVQMDSCMKTSRIKQAISSVQLFVQRTLMNLEPQVASSSINARQWAWMKRYRVWEANRKVFLWPENWLEPELRDNKSPFFKEFESELLQSDITDDAAATALVHYLEKLDEVAKLEICGMYYEENELNYEADDIVHVIARTAGARRTYYYRRQEGGTSWTPWEKIDLNIEDNPVLPVVWKGRLFLFWVSVLQEAAPEPTSSDPPADEPNLTEVKLSQLKGAAGEAKMRVGVVLYWSEYYHGKWQPARTSDVNKPLTLGDNFLPSGNGAFDRAALKLVSLGSGELLISVVYKNEIRNHYTLYNTHSLPMQTRSSILVQIGVKSLTVHRNLFYETPASFTIKYSNLGEQTFDRKVLTKASQYEIIDPRHRVAGIFEAPFFFQNGRHVFYVTSKANRVSVGEVLNVGPRLPEVIVASPPVVVRPDFSRLSVVLPSVSTRADPRVVDPSPRQAFLRENRHVHQVIGTTGTIRFGNRLIAPGGSTGFDHLDRSFGQPTRR